MFDVRFLRLTFGNVLLTFQLVLLTSLKCCSHVFQSLSLFTGSLAVRLVPVVATTVPGSSASDILNVSILASLSKKFFVGQRKLAICRYICRLLAQQTLANFKVTNLILSYKIKCQQITANMALWHKYGFFKIIKWQKERKGQNIASSILHN